MEMSGQGYAPAALPSGMTLFLLYRRLGVPQGRSGRVWNTSPPPDSRACSLSLYRPSYPGPQDSYTCWCFYCARKFWFSLYFERKRGQF